MKEKRKPIAELPVGVGVSKVVIKGSPFWRVRLGKKFTGGEIRIRHVTDLDSARKWILGEKPEPEEPGPRLIQPGIVAERGYVHCETFATELESLIAVSIPKSA